MSAIKRVKANQVDFAYLEDGQGPLVLLLHGFPDTAHSWDEVRPVLAAAGHRAVSPFMRGYFPSSIPESARYDIDTLGDDVLSLIGALGEGSAIIVGHDWGAAAAYSATARAPDQVRMLVTIGIPHARAVRAGPRLAWRGRHFVRLRLPGAADRVRDNDFAYVDELVRRWSPAWDFPPTETAPVKDVFRKPGCVEAAIGYYRASNRLPQSLREPVRVPSAAFAGADDPFFRIDDYERARPLYSDHYEIVRMPGGHFLHREHSKRFIEELLRVLQWARK